MVVEPKPWKIEWQVRSMIFGYRCSGAKFMEVQFSLDCHFQLCIHQGVTDNLKLPSLSIIIRKSIEQRAA